MYKKGVGNDKQGKDAGNRTLCLYRNFSQAIKLCIILVGVELPLCVVVTILECCVTFSGVKLSIRSFVLFL